jgi:hypothetical protein
MGGARDLHLVAEEAVDMQAEGSELGQRAIEKSSLYTKGIKEGQSHVGYR